MKLQQCISYLFFVIAITVLTVFFVKSNDINSQAPNDQVETNTRDSLNPMYIRNQVPLHTTNSKVVTEGFYLREENGFISVYLHDKETLFERTNIAVANLELTLQEEIKTDKYIKNMDELYGFLENYSS